MIRFFRALLASPRKPDPVPLKQLDIELARIDGALVEEEHFPRPQWKVIHAWVKQHVAEADLPIAWQEVSSGWVAALKRHLNGDYAVYHSPNFVLLTSRSRDAARSILRICEVAVQLLVNWLGPIAEKRGHGKHVILDFDSIENYYDYVSYFYREDSGVRASGGVFLRGGYHHIAMPPSKSMQDTLIHELTHNRLAHLPLPPWLNEGIAITMERKIGGKKHGQIDREQFRKHHDYWTKETIPKFWSGESFDDDDGEVVGLSYGLADIFTDLLVQEFPNFMEFVAEANHQDAGQSAAVKCFDITLNDLASTFLGPGEWA
jgi:hypothetical protein